MLCPFCREKDTSVVDSRPTEDGAAIRRRRVCACERKERFTTFERVQFRELTVVKNNGRKVPFDRDKIAKSIIISPDLGKEMEINGFVDGKNCDLFERGVDPSYIFNSIEQ